MAIAPLIERHLIGFVIGHPSEGERERVVGVGGWDKDGDEVGAGIKESQDSG